MSTCPICHSDNHANARDCHYCGSSLIDRRHSAPSIPAPILRTRQQSTHDPLGSGALSTLPNQKSSTTREELEFQQSLDSDTGGGSFTIDDEATADYDGHDEPMFPDLDAPARAAHPLDRHANIKTIDEAATDGLRIIDLDTPLPTPVQQYTPQSDKPIPRLSDWSGEHIHPLGEELYSEEPRFGNPTSLSRTFGNENQLSTEFLSIPKSLQPKRINWIIPLSLLVLGGLSWALDLFSLLTPQNDKASSVTEITSMRPVQFSSLDQPRDGQSSSTSNSPESHVIVPKIPDDPVIQKQQSPAPIVPALSGIQNPTTEKRKTPRSSSRGAKRSKRQSSSAPSTGAGQSYTSLMERGAQLLNRGKVKEARRLFNAAGEANPKSVDPLNQLAWCEINTKNYRAALNFFKQALQRSPRNGESIYGMGYAFNKLGDNAKAREHYERYLELYPTGKNASIIKAKLRRF